MVNSNREDINKIRIPEGFYNIEDVYSILLRRIKAETMSELGCPYCRWYDNQIRQCKHVMGPAIYSHWIFGSYSPDEIYLRKLHINCENGQSHQLGTYFVNHWAQTHPAEQVIPSESRYGYGGIDMVLSGKGKVTRNYGGMLVPIPASVARDSQMPFKVGMMSALRLTATR